MPDDDTRTAAPPDPAATATGPAAGEPGAAPECVDRFRILGELARGGMGVVYRAHDPDLDREVAVKVLSDRLAGLPATRRFRDEARVTGQLQHPNIPAVHEVGTLPDGRPFLAMKLIKGSTLDDRLKGSADRGELIAVFEHVCQAVAYAHAHGVIHRDLKPANVMVGAFGEVQVMDWGLAKLLTGDRPEPTPAGSSTEVTEIRTTRDSDGSFTQAGSVMGTPAYMPPEQAGGETALVDRRADVFGLGAVLCAILTGKPPYVGADAEAVRLMAVRGQLADAFARLDACGAEPEWAALAKRCLAADRGDRPADAADVLATVAGLRAAAEERARRAELDRATAAVRAAEQRKRRRVQQALIAVGVFVVAAAGVVAWWQDRQITVQNEQRQQRWTAEVLEYERKVTRLRAGVTLALDQADAALKADRPDEAEVALTQAADRLIDGGPTELVERLADTKRDLELYRELDRVRDRHWGRGIQDDSWSAYRDALNRYGLVGVGLTADQAAARVRAGRAGRRITEALDDALASARSGAVVVQDPPEVAFVTDVLHRLDPDPVAAAVRAAGDYATGRLAELAGRADGAALRPSVAARLILSTQVPRADAHRILRAAVRAHPTDFLVLYAAGYRLTSDGEDTSLPDRLALLEEGIGYYRAAIAVRPRYANTYHDLGTALNEKKDWVGAEAALRTAFRIGESGFDNYNHLAVALAGQRRYADALRVMRASLAANPGLAVNPLSSIRYNAACMAARCGTGQGANPPPRIEWSGLRREALAWLTADLVVWKARVATGARATTHGQIEHWLDDEDLFVVRHPIGVGLLPADERAAWRALWSEVRALYDATAERESAPPPRPAP